MELIDRQALVKKMKETYCTDCENYNGIKCRACWIDEAIGTVDDAPVVDAVEVVHGRWIDKQTGAYGRWQSWCSACGKHSGIGGIESNRHKLYCPNCGAKMDGGA